MHFIIKLLISVAVIILCTQIGRKVPALAGLIATMPLTSLIVLIWLYTDNPGDYALMTTFSMSALWGILPSIMFFLFPSISVSPGTCPFQLSQRQASVFGSSAHVSINRYWGSPFVHPQEWSEAMIHAMGAKL